MMIKGRDNTTSIVGYPTLFTKVGARFPNIPIMRHYQCVTHNFGKMTFSKIIEKIM